MTFKPKILEIAAGGTGQSTLPASSKVTTYTSNGTWTIDPRAVIVEFYVWGGGSGGASGRSGASASAGGGAGGPPGNMLHIRTEATKLISSPYTITIGAGGIGGTSVSTATTNGNPGGAGQASSVGSIITSGNAPMPVGGTVTTSSSGSSVFYNSYGFSTTSSPASGSATLAGTPNPMIYGWASPGGGGSGYVSGTPRLGAAGGNITDPSGTVLVAGGLAGANTGATAGNGNTPGSLQLLIGGSGGGGGGNDGNATTPTAGTGGNGAIPGGGGGGGSGTLSGQPSGAGGNGAKGQIIIIEYF